MIQYSYTFDPETRTLTPSGDPVNVKNDVNVVQIIFTIPASYEGLALSSYVWRVFYKIAMNTKLEEVRFHQFTNPTTEGENLILTWTVTNSVTEFAGHLGFALSGTLTDTGGNVTNRINSIPAYERIEPTIGGGSYTEDDAEIEGIKDFLVGIQEAAEEAQAAAETAEAEAEASAERAEQIADELEPYKSLAIVESASGDPATFTDGSNGVPMKSVSVDIDPVQDLNGYEYPWVGGAGKNKLEAKTGATGTSSGITWVVNADGSITLNGTASSDVAFIANLALGTANTSLQNDQKKHIANGTWYIYSGSSDIKAQIIASNVSGTSSVSVLFNNASGTCTVDDTYAYNWIRLYATSGTTFSNATIKPYIVASTDTHEWSPYSNICPISGWDEVKVTRCGVNIWDEEWETGMVSVSGGSEAIATAIRSKNPIVVAPNTEYYFKGARRSWFRTAWYDEYMNLIGSVRVNNSTDVETSPTGARYLRFSTDGTYGGTYNNDISINSPSADHDYHAYAGQTYSISLTSAGTVYGGTLDATTGELVVDRKMVDFDGTESWGTEVVQNVRSFYLLLSNANKMTDRRSGALYSELLSNEFVGTNVTGAGQIYVSAGGYLNCRTSNNFSDVETWKSFLTSNPLKVIYPLATPLTYTLTPSQITSLLGTNHILADCGEVAVEYVADTKMYIGKIVASL